MQNQLSSRRDFIFKTTAAGTALLLNPIFSWAGKEEDKIAKIVAKTFGIDTHNHVDVPFNAEDFIGQQYDLAGELKKSGLGAVCMTFSVDRPALKQSGDAYNRFITSLNEQDVILKANNIKRALNYSDIKKARQNKKPVVIQSVEGGHFLEGKIERLSEAYNRGLRLLGLLHDNDAIPPLGDIYTNPAQYGGLTDLGARLIKECNRLGILIDLTHCSDDTINEALKISTKPLMVSHTSLNTQLGKNENMNKMMMPRLIKKEQAKIVAESGGVIGVWKHLTETPAEYVQNILAMVDVVGVDHVCIGTDTKLATITKAGAENKPARVGEQTNNVWQNQSKGFYFEAVENMLQAGFSEKEIGKIGSGNFLKIFEAATFKNK
ncbi:MAG: membrane dipeptidase [Bacteroidota bacterium]